MPNGTNSYADIPRRTCCRPGAWGDLKSAFGWEPVRLVHENVGAQVLFRKLPAGLSVAYLPKGPVGHHWQAFWPELDRICRQKRAIFLKVEPDVWEPLSEDKQAELVGFHPDGVPVQPRRTLLIDLQGERKNGWRGCRKKRGPVSELRNRAG